jgi:hypothetical protein
LEFRFSFISGHNFKTPISIGNWRNPYIVIHYFGNYPINEAQLAPHAGRRSGGGPIMRTPKKRNKDQLLGNNPMARAINSAVASITGGAEGMDAVLALTEDDESSSSTPAKKRKLADPLNVYGTVVGECLCK